MEVNDDKQIVCVMLLCRGFRKAVAVLNVYCHVWGMFVFIGNDWMHD